MSGISTCNNNVASITPSVLAGSDDLLDTFSHLKYLLWFTLAYREYRNEKWKGIRQVNQEGVVVVLICLCLSLEVWGKISQFISCERSEK